MYFTKTSVLNWYSSIKNRKIQMFFGIRNWLWISKSHDFDANVLSQHFKYIYKKTQFATFYFFCKNEACVNCGTHKLNFRFDIQIVCYRSELNLNFLKCLLTKLSSVPSKPIKQKNLPTSIIHWIIYEYLRKTWLQDKVEIQLARFR